MLLDIRTSKIVKVLMSSNVLSGQFYNIMGVYYDLELISTKRLAPKIIAMRRGLKINDITKRRKFNEVSDNVKN